jgi:hypothetical protein
MLLCMRLLDLLKRSKKREYARTVAKCGFTYVIVYLLFMIRTYGAAADVHMFEMDCVLTSSKVETFLMRTRWGRSILEVDAKLRPVCVLYVLFCFFSCDILQLIHTVHIDLIDWCFCQGHLISRNVPLFAKQIARVPPVWRMYLLITHWYQI